MYTDELKTSSGMSESNHTLTRTCPERYKPDIFAGPV